MSISRGIIDLLNEIKKETRDGKLLKIIVSPIVLQTIRHENKDALQYSNSNEVENLKNKFYDVEIESTSELTDLKAKYEKAVSALNRIVSGLDEKGPRVIAANTLAELGEE